MLKKAAIVVAASAAGILALTPLAFAGDSHDSHHHYGKGHTVVKKEDTSKGNLSNDCQFGNGSGDATAGVFGGSSLLGALAAPLTSAATNATSQLNTLNCTNVNVSDLVDNDSNNRDETNEQTWIKKSFNGS